MVAGILTDLSSPSASFLNSLVQLISEERLENDILGSVCLGTGSLGSKAGIKLKNKISNTFVELLEEQKDNCYPNDLLLDILEAVGNLACRKTVPSVLQVRIYKYLIFSCFQKI